MGNEQLDLLSHRIKTLSSQKGVSVSQMLKDCSLNKNLVYQIEKRGSIPSAEKIAKIADYFNVPTDYLMGYTNESAKKEPDLIKGLAQDLERILIETQIISPADDLSEHDYHTILKFLEANFTANAELIKQSLDKG